MLTKLTLTIDRDIVLKAKNYAQKKHRSVSKLVEDYLKTISDAETSRIENHENEAPLTNSITGMFREEYGGQSYEDLLQSALMERNT
jgi:predicted nucleic acid-binding protein